MRKDYYPVALAVAGAALSLIIFREFPGLQFVAAIPIMIIGAALLLGERHDHMHIHAVIEHDDERR